VSTVVAVVDASPDDVDWVLDRLGAASAEKLGSSEQVVVLAVDSGERVGGALAWKNGSVLDIDALWVEPSARGGGLARRLLTLLEQRGRELGCHTVVVESATSEAPGLYLRSGYQELARVQLGPREHRFYLMRLLELDGRS
jgi:GNAT superfamily N-acetyltransferase